MTNATHRLPIATMSTAVPAPTGIVGGRDGQKFRFTVLGDGLLRLEWAPDCIFEDRPSAFAANRDKASIPKYEVKESYDTLEIITSRFHLTYNLQEFAAHGLYALVFGFTRSLWRYKEEQPNLGSTCRTLDDVDGRIHKGRGQEIRLEPGVISTKGYALINDSYSMLFEDNGFVASRRPGENRLDCYLFAYGHDYRDAIQALYSISGPTPLLPRWALGNWWSRYHRYTAKSYIELIDMFQKQGIPLSVAVIDMDWHLVDDPRVIESGQTGWTGYTWNKDLFPDPPAFLRELRIRKLATSLNDHPADGIHSYEDKYQAVAKALHHDTSNSKPIPFNCVSPEYLHAYFNILLRPLEEDGCDFWWIDWQQGPFSLLKGVDPLWVLNHYHFLHNAKIGNRYPIIFSRYAGPGSHRYPIGFSGDTHVSWASLDFQPEFTATASNIGYGWWSHDIGGHMSGIRDDELTTRWTQLGVLSPIMRFHSVNSRWVTKEPWRLPAQPMAVIRNFLRLRHRLIPYLQTMNVRASMGEPLIQPMYWDHPKRDEAYNFKNQYMFGSEMAVIPITTQQDKELKLGKAKGWLPPGTHVDFFTGAVYEGDRIIWVSRPLEQYPVFLKQGSIVPLDSAAEPENGGGCPAGFEVIVIVGADGKFNILEQPAIESGTENEGILSKWSCIPIQYMQKAGTLQIGPVSSPSIELYGQKSRSWSVRLLGASEPREISVSMGTKNVAPKVTHEANGIVIELGEVAVRETITVHLGSNPLLRENDVVDLLEPILQQAQIEYDIKDKIWEVLVDQELPISGRISRLQTMDMSSNLRLLLNEFLLADCRL